MHVGYVLCCSQIFNVTWQNVKLWFKTESHLCTLQHLCTELSTAWFVHSTHHNRDPFWYQSTIVLMQCLCSAPNIPCPTQFTKMLNSTRLLGLVWIWTRNDLADPELVDLLQTSDVAFAMMISIWPASELGRLMEDWGFIRFPSKFVSNKAHTLPSLLRCLFLLKPFHFCAQAN